MLNGCFSAILGDTVNEKERVKIGKERRAVNVGEGKYWNHSRKLRIFSRGCATL